MYLIYFLLALVVVLWLGARGIGVRNLAYVALAAGVVAIVGVPEGDLDMPNPFNLLNYLALLPGAALWLFSVPSLRLKYFSRRMYKTMKASLPPISATEQEALEAGSVSFDGQLFSGEGDLTDLLKEPAHKISAEEQEFIDGPTEELCRMLKEWDVRKKMDLEPKVWKFIKSQGFLGMIIPKSYGGLDFSAEAQSRIIARISTISPTAAVSVMVPNSLGPGELLLKYGTEEQKNHFLPRLARGEDIPCFALTGPHSGSDAAAMPDVGVICKGEHEGKETLGIRLNWDKRYITLAPVATILGLAFRCHDPDGLLGGKEELGITCALVPTKHKGVVTGERHFPSGCAFQNGPTRGKDVFIPIDWVIGGQGNVGKGWRMLMSCLAVGRAISLPSTGSAATQAMLKHSAAYAALREQFNRPIAQMEGIIEPLAQLLQNAYVLECTRLSTNGLLQGGAKPAVISALFKYQSTARMRESVYLAMDIHGGKAICDGPNNYISAAYNMLPIAITVEGANILTRSLITFAQGALRAHPYLLDEFRALQIENTDSAVQKFDELLKQHVSWSARNVLRAWGANLSGGRFLGGNDSIRVSSKLIKQWQRRCLSFAVLADMTIGILGGKLKQKQMISGRLADALSVLYMSACVIKTHHENNYPEADKLLVKVSLQNLFAEFDQCLQAVITNFPVTPVRWLLRAVLAPYGFKATPASDRDNAKIVADFLSDADQEQRLTHLVHVPDAKSGGSGLLYDARAKMAAVEETLKNAKKLLRSGKIQRRWDVDWLEEAARELGLDADAKQRLQAAVAAYDQVVAVDSFAKL